MLMVIAVIVFAVDFILSAFGVHTTSNFLGFDSLTALGLTLASLHFVVPTAWFHHGGGTVRNNRDVQ